MVSRRRNLVWNGATTDFGDLAVGSQTNLLLFNDTTFGGLHVKGTTLTRTLIDLRLRADAVAQDVQLTWGITTVNSDARAAGAFPDPNDHGDRASWVVRGRMLTIQDSLSDKSQWDIAQLDLRSQRVFRDEQQELHLILNNSGAFVLEWAAFVRVLLKEGA